MTIAVAPRRGERSMMTDRKAFLHALTASGVAYAVLRDWGTTREGAPAHPDGRSESSLELLVHRDALVEIDELAGRHGLVGSSVEGKHTYRHSVNGWTVRARWELRYGAKVSWLSTDEREERVLRRAEVVHGVRVAAITDQLVDTVLHCLLDLAALPSAYRRSLSEMLATLRADPPAAGRAAERVQQELAPALTWSDLLADILHERWNELLSRRARLRLHLWRRAPLLSTRRYLAGLKGFPG